MSEEIATYTIDNKQYTQTFLTIEQTIQLTKVMKGVNLDLNNIQILTVLEQITKSGHLQGILEIILVGPKPIPIKKIKPALLLKIIGDFFSFNEIFDLISTISDLMGLVNESGVLPQLTAKMKSVKPTGTSSSQPQRTEISPNTGISENESI